MTHPLGDALRELIALRAENDRLREALEQISNAGEYWGHGLTVHEIARAALIKEQRSTT
jgi:hypothetical protein